MEPITKFASTESHIHLGNDDPDLVSIFGGWGTEDRGRALAYENRPQLNSATTFNNLIIVNKRGGLTNDVVEM
jgi:hypothetical protein